MRIIMIKITIALLLLSGASLAGYWLYRSIPDDSDIESNNPADLVDVGTLRGVTYKTSGNCMPRVVEDSFWEGECKTEPITAVVQVRKLQGVNDREFEVIEEIETDENGNFTIELPTGQYSIFVGEPGATCAGVDCVEFHIQFTCTFSDGDYWCPVKVNAGESTEYNPEIDLAVY